MRSKTRLIERAFAGSIAMSTGGVTGAELVDTVLAGGYPAMLQRRDAARRRTWARDYVRAIVARDVRDVAEVYGLDEIPRLMRALAHHASSLLNATELGGQLGLDAKTVRRYIGILEQVSLVRLVEPWSTNRLSRLIKTPKLQFLDAGLLAALGGVTTDRIGEDRRALGPVLETFVYAEVIKQLGWLDDEIAVYHYRDKDKRQVDLVLERDDGAVVGLEVKASASVTNHDFAGQRRLADACGSRFKAGLALYDGDVTVAFGPRLHAVPVGSLW